MHVIMNFHLSTYFPRLEHQSLDATLAPTAATSFSSPRAAKISAHELRKAEREKEAKLKTIAAEEAKWREEDQLASKVTSSMNKGAGVPVAYLSLWRMFSHYDCMIHPLTAAKGSVYSSCSG